jgi:hypothetical protein
MFLIVSLTFSKTISIFTYQRSTRQRKRHSVNNDMNILHDSHILIQVNPLSRLDDVDHSRQQSTTIPFDDDEELIKPDILSSFCENDLIELRLDQDLEYDDDVENRNNN